LKLFSVAIIRVSCSAGQVLTVASKYGSIVIAVSVVTANCLLQTVRNCKYVLLIQSYSIYLSFR